MLINKKIDLGSPNELTRTTQQLRNNLQSLAPNNSELTQTITYTLIATAIVGIMVYHYIKAQENTSFNQEPRSQGVLINSVKENNLC